MAGYLPPTLLRAAPMPSCLPSHHTRPGHIGLSSAAARRNPALPAKTTGSSEAEAEGDSATKLSAWTSVRQERWEGDLAVEGHLPLWLNGTYLRNGPGVWQVGDDGALDHLFDGYAMLVRVSFRRGRATSAHRQLESDAYKAAREHGRPLLREFGHCPKPPVSLLDRVRNVVGLVTGETLTDNANVAVLPLGDDGRVMCLTETIRGSFLIDPHTLGTVGRFRYADTLGATNMVQSGHPIVTGSELWTLLPDLVRPGYLLVRMAAGSNERKVVGRVGCRGGPTPRWVHSFAVTENYVVVPEMPLRYSASSMIMSEPAQFYLFDWLPASGSYMHVVRKSIGKTVASVEVPPFMAIHFINAYEEKSEYGQQAAAVIVDCCECYADPAILDALALHKLRSPRNNNAFPDGRIGRFRIPLDGRPLGELEPALDPDEHGRGMDLCSINPACLGKEYRYAYGCSARRPCSFLNSLAKIDLVENEKAAKIWHDEGCASPSEPLFVARPGATSEDDGVVVSIVSDVHGGGYVLVLDGKTFQEIARVRLPYGLPYGFHGCWIPAGKI